MEAFLDRLAKQYALVWLAYVTCAWLLALQPAGSGLVVWIVVGLVAAITVVTFLDHVYRYAPLQRAMEAVGQESVPRKRETVLGVLYLSSAAMMIASFWVFDLHDDAVLPFFLSVMVPGVLKRRQGELDLVVSRQRAG